MPEDIEASIGSRKRFECQVIGYPTPKITWLKDNININKCDRYKFDYSSDGYVTLEIENITYADVGSYQCLAVNSEGWASTTAHLKVKGRGVDSSEDTMTIHRMTFENGGPRRGSTERPLIFRSDGMGKNDWSFADHVERTFEDTDLKSIQLALSEEGLLSGHLIDSKNPSIQFPCIENVKNAVDQCDLKKELVNANEVSLKDKQENTDDPLDGTDSGFSGHFSLASSVNQNQCGQVTANEPIIISVVDDDENVGHIENESETCDVIGFLKAGDNKNRSRRLTTDSGIADDDYSSPEEEVSQEKTKQSQINNRKIDTTLPENKKAENNAKELCDKVLNDKVHNTKDEIPEVDKRKEKSDNNTRTNERNEKSVTPITKTTEVNKNRNINIESEKDSAVGDGNKIDEPCQAPSQDDLQIQIQDSVVKDKDLTLEGDSHYNNSDKQTNNKPAVDAFTNSVNGAPNNNHGETLDESDEGDERFHSDEEEHQILAEIRPNLRLRKTPMDDTRSNTMSFQSGESWSIYDSCGDYTLSESNFDTLSYQIIDEEDEREFKPDKINASDLAMEDFIFPLPALNEIVDNSVVLDVERGECSKVSTTEAQSAKTAVQPTNEYGRENGKSKNIPVETEVHIEKVHTADNEKDKPAKKICLGDKLDQIFKNQDDEFGEIVKSKENQNKGSNYKISNVPSGKEANPEQEKEASGLTESKQKSKENMNKDNDESTIKSNEQQNCSIDTTNDELKKQSSVNKSGTICDSSTLDSDGNVDSSDSGNTLGKNKSKNDQNRYDVDGPSSSSKTDPKDLKANDRNKQCDGRVHDEFNDKIMQMLIDKAKDEQGHQPHEMSSSDECSENGSVVSEEVLEEERTNSLRKLDLRSYLIKEVNEEEELACHSNDRKSTKDRNVNEEEGMFASNKGKSTSGNEDQEKEDLGENNSAAKRDSKASSEDDSASSDSGTNCDFLQEMKLKELVRLLHLTAMQCEMADKAESLTDMSDNRPALPNVLNLNDDKLLASVMNRIATETGLQIRTSPPDLEEMEIDWLTANHVLSVIPNEDLRPILSPISEEGAVLSPISEEEMILSPVCEEEVSLSSACETKSEFPSKENALIAACEAELGIPIQESSDISNQNETEKQQKLEPTKLKRPSLIGLTITDADGLVEEIDLDKIDAAPSFSPLQTMGEIPRIVKGPSSVTSIDGGEIVLEWTITGSPEPEVVVFKDGDSLDICDGITLDHTGDKWTLLISDVIKEDAGLYEICAVNSSGNDIMKTRVNVKEVRNAPEKPKNVVNNDERNGCSKVPEFVQSPINIDTTEGLDVRVKCEVTGEPVPEITWLKNGSRLQPDDRIQYLHGNTELVISPAAAEDCGIYMCRAANNVGVNQVQFTVSVNNQADTADGENNVGENDSKLHDQGNRPTDSTLTEADQRPMAPMLQMDMSESDECFSRKYEVVTDYHDKDNNIDLQAGEIIEVIDRSQPSHWLVKSLKDQSKICYVPPHILETVSSGDILQYKKGDRQLSVADLKERKKKVLKDLVESEADYICDLKDLIDTYKESTKGGRKSNREPVNEGNISKATADKCQDDIFERLTNLYQFHKRTLLPGLLVASKDTEKLGEAFMKKNSSFSEYVPFVSEHDKILDNPDSDQLKALMETFSLLLGDPASAFEDLLNRPLERIHEYIDLLKTLIKLTAQSGGDCSGLMSAVQMLSEICRHMEDIVLLDRIQGYDGDVKTLGPVLKHETIAAIEDENKTQTVGQRHVILFPDKIMVTKSTSSEPNSKLEFERIIELKDVTVHDKEDGCDIELWEGNSCELTSSAPIKLKVQDKHKKQAWVRDIQEAKKLILETKEDTYKPNTMPEFTQKLKGKKLSSTPKKSKLVKTVDTVDVESDRSSDDFNILGTRKDLVGDRYVAAEFEDGTTRPMFRQKLQKTIVEEGTNAKLECEVAGIPQPKVLWLKNNRPLFESDHCRVMTDGATHILEFTDARRSDTGLYTARAMNVNGSTISTAELYVGEVQPALLNKYKEGLSDSKYQTPAYFFQMNSCQVEEGRLARFDCRVVAYPKPDIVWMKDGKIVEPNDRYQLLNFNNEIYSLLIQNVTEADMGRYTCWAHNKYGEAMTEAYLNVISFHDQEEEGDIAPHFLTRFYDQTLTEGVPAELQCLIHGRPMPTIKWLFNDIEIIPSDNVAVLQENNLCSLFIKSVTHDNLGTYTCNLKNHLGEASCSAGLNVLNEKIKNVPVLPKFLKRITDENVRTGEKVTFEVVVIGEPPPKVTWLFNHKAISETRRRFTQTQEGDICRLTIEDLVLDDDGKITCKAVNSEGEVYSSGNLLVRESRRTTEKPDEPKFTQKDFDAKYGYLPTFIKKIEDISIPSGKDGKFECRIMGIPEPSVTWMKDGRQLANDGHYFMSQDSGCCYLTIRGAREMDQGVYTCTIANAAGENSCTASMKMAEAKKPGDIYDKDSPVSLSRRGTGEVPTMPYEKPTVSDARPESVRLTWQPVLTSTLSNDARNVKYVIEGRELPDAEWRKMASGIHGNTHVVRSLRPQRDYDFRVRAENKFGVSDATQPAMLERPRPAEDDFAESMKTKVPQFRRPPELPRSRPLVADIGTESVKLAWQPAPVPRDLKAPPPPITYRLEAQELPATDWLPLSSRLSDTSAYLSDLLPDRDYNIRVRAENKYGLSEPTDSIWIPRARAFPGVPIARPEIIEMEPQSVKLRWERVDVPSFSSGDDSLMYMIEMQAPPMRDWSTVARDVPSTVYVVSDLEPGQDYRFRVRARTPRGVMSEPSPMTSLYRTVASSMVPIDHFELEDDEVDYEGIRLRWNRVQVPPYSSDEEPLLYMIEMSEPPLDEWQPVVSGLPTTRYRVTDLLPDRDYNFRVRALSSYGVSPPSYTLPVSYRRPLPGPSRHLPEYTKITYDETDALQLAWQPPKIKAPTPLKYRVELQAPPSLQWKPLATGIPDTRYPIRGLGPSRDYMFRVVPETPSGLLEPLPPVSLTSLPAPRTFLPSAPEIHDYSPDSMQLVWRRPYIDSQHPLLYRIEVQEPPSIDWRPLVSGVTDTSYRVSGLAPSRDYSFRVVPYTATDQWQPLPPVTISSLPVKPRFRPHEPTIKPLDTDSVRLSWQPADIPVYPRKPVPIRYIVDMRTLPRYDWVPLAHDIHDTSYTVKGLNSSKEYQFRIRPQADYGIGEPTMPVTFYRKPVPLIRREPIISNIYGDSVLLSWQPADVSGDYKIPPKVTYSIEQQDRPGVGPWLPVTTGIQNTNYHVTGLHPDREYFFRIRAHVGDVFGEPSAPVYLTHRAGPPKMPYEQPYISELSPNSLHLQWRAVHLPHKITDYAPVTYRLEIQELPRSDWDILADGIPHTDFHVTNLNADKEYNFRVRAVNKYGYSEPTPLVQVRRRAVPPKMPKDEPMIYDIGHGSLMLSWRPADVPFYLGDSPVTYTIYVQDLPSTTWRPLYRRIPYTSYHVTNLSPDRDYCFRIQAENAYGVSQPTNTVRLTRLSDFKSPIDLPEITEFDETRSSLMLQWRPRPLPQFDCKPVKYHIESWEPVQRTWRRMVSDVPDTSYRLSGLSPENDYILRVIAEAESALSAPSYPISTSRFRARAPITRPQLYDVESDSVRLSWSPYPGRAPPRRYKLEMRETSAKDWRPVTTDVYGTTHKVTGLKPKYDYEFRVRGITDQGPTDYVYSVPLHRRSVVPRLPLAGVDIVDVEDDYVDLRWRMVDIPAFSYDEKPLAFLVEAQQLPRSDWLPVASGISNTNYRVKGLQRHQDYTFRIRGEYPSGLSKPSPHISVFRRPNIYSELLAAFHGRPGVPIARPEIIDEDQSTARLRWHRVYTPPYHRHSDPLTYQIEVQEAPYRDWRHLASGITMTEHAVTDLMPKKDYLFRIRAESQNGDVSDPTPPVAYYKSHSGDEIIMNELNSSENKCNINTSNIPVSQITNSDSNLEDVCSNMESSQRDIELSSIMNYEKNSKIENDIKMEQTCSKKFENIERTEGDYSVDKIRNTRHNIADILAKYGRKKSTSESEKMSKINDDDEDFVDCNSDTLSTSSSSTVLSASSARKNISNVLAKYGRSKSNPESEETFYDADSVPECDNETFYTKRPVTSSYKAKSDIEEFKASSTSSFRNKSEIEDIIVKYSTRPSRKVFDDDDDDDSDILSKYSTRPTRKVFNDDDDDSDILSKYSTRPTRKAFDDESDDDDNFNAYEYKVPSPRTTRKTIDYKAFEQDFSLPSRKYVDHLTTFIPPRLPLDKPDMTEDGKSTVTLRWKPAQVPERTREKYPVTYSIEVKNPPNLEWREIEGGLTCLSHKLENIHPEIDYMFRIRAHNEFGSSEATLPVSLYRPIEIEPYYDDEYDSDYEIPLVTLGDCEGPIDEVPPKLPMETPRLTNISGDRVTIHWLSARIPAYAKKVPITYIVEVKEENMPGFSRLQSGLTDTKFNIDGLNANMSYQFRVKAETQFGCSDPTLAVVLDRNKDEQETKDLQLDDVKNLIQSIQDKIKRPVTDTRRDDFDIPQKKIRDVVPTGIPPRMSSSRPIISNHFGSDLTLTWGPGRVPSYVKGSTIKYIVEKKEPHHSTWMTIADNLIENEFDVTGLSKDRDYMFRVRAKNEYGVSEPTMPCSVINVKDEYVPPVFSRSQSRDSGTPRMSRRSSLESPLSLSRQMSLDESDDSYRTSLPPEFKSTVEELQYGVVGKTAKLNLAIRGFPLPVVEWSFKGDNLSSNKTKYKPLITPSGVVTLDIYNFTLEDVGEYKCTAENDHGFKVFIVQLEAADSPTFMEPSEDLFLDSHKSGKFECRVDGIPYPKVRWMKDCRYITESSRIKITHTKPNLWTLSLTDVISLDGGLYTCVAENVAGKSTCSSSLFVDDDSDNEELEGTKKLIYFREALFEDYYYPVEELGRGRHGIVQRVIQKSTGDEYAAKIIPACNEELKYFFGHELNNLRKINNQRVPMVVDAFQAEKQLIIVMELCKGKSLINHVLSCDSWNESEAVKYIKQLLEILRSTHASNIIHLDIKPSNIIMAEPDSDQIRLIDFGLSRQISLDYDVKMNYGTDEFTSPEQIDNEPVSSASDMWSVGVLTYILLSGVSPLRGKTDAETLKNVLEGKLTLSEDNFKLVSEDAKDFLAELLVVDDCDRLTAAECLKHPWITDTAGKSTKPLDLGPLKAFYDADKVKRDSTSIRSVPRLDNLQSILEGTVPSIPLVPVQDDQSKALLFPDSDYFGEYLDEESWYDWQNRYHRGPGAKVVSLTENDYLARIPGLKSSRKPKDVDEGENEEGEKKPSKKRICVMEAEKNLHEDSCLQKELQYQEVAEDIKQRKPKEIPQSEVKEESLQIISKFSDMAFNPNETIVLRCTYQTDEPPAVTWYRNEELVSESARLAVKITNTLTSLTVYDVKPYDAGIYKCIIRSKGGKATAVGRVLAGEAPSQPSRPVASKVSSTQVLLLWEPPVTNGNAYITGYRVDCKKKSSGSWSTVSTSIDECALVSGLVPNTSYRFRVCAENQFGFSAYSVASPEIVTEEEGETIIVDDYTSGILSRQSGTLVLSSPAVIGQVELTEGSYKDKYDITDTLYSGKFSELKMVRKIETGQSFMAKIPTDKAGGLKEFELLKTLNQEKIVRLYDAYLFSEKLYIITEYLYGVNVLQHFAFKSKYSEDMVAIVIRQILEGVQYLEHMGVVHLNLQPSSIVMRSRRHLDLKICGFVHAQKMTSAGQVVPCKGYPDFMAPEVIQGEITSYSADIWTVGVLAFMLLSGESPFRGLTVEQTYSNIVYSRYDAHGLHDIITRDALRFINKIMKRLPRNCPSTQDLLDDKWLLIADTTVKARQEAVFTTTKLRNFAAIYRERGILGTWQPDYVPDAVTKQEVVTEQEPVKEEVKKTKETKEEETSVTSKLSDDKTEETSADKPVADDKTSSKMEEDIDESSTKETTEEEKKDNSEKAEEKEDETTVSAAAEKIADDVVLSAIDKALSKKS